MDNPEDRYKTGFRRPPKDKQFKKGTSGNPKGRPKGSRNFASKFHEIGSEVITVSIAGRARSMTKQEAMIHQLVNRAVGGDLKAFLSYMQAYRLFQHPEADQEMVPQAPNAQEETIMKDFFKQMQKMSVTEQDDSTASATKKNTNEDK